MTKKIVRTIKVMNPSGLHARPASIFVKLAGQFECEVLMSKDGETVNGKSMMNLLTLAAEPGAEIEVTCDGVDAEKAMNVLEEFLINPKDDAGDRRRA